MPIDAELKKVIVIGSGPIVIGQAAEFDYAGTQACGSLREQNLEVVLVNSNPATIMTDADIADTVYIEPLTVEFIERIIAREKPQGLLATMGGQIGLNLAVEAEQRGILARYGVRLLGTPYPPFNRPKTESCLKRPWNISVSLYRKALLLGQSEKLKHLPR